MKNINFDSLRERMQILRTNFTAKDALGWNNICSTGAPIEKALYYVQTIEARYNGISIISGPQGSGKSLLAKEAIGKGTYVQLTQKGNLVQSVTSGPTVGFILFDNVTKITKKILSIIAECENSSTKVIICTQKSNLTLFLNHIKIELT